MTNYDLDALADVMIAHPETKESLLPILNKMIVQVRQNAK